MSQLNIEILKAGQESQNPIPDNMWDSRYNAENTLVIEKATILDLKDGRYPQIQLVVKNPKTGKYISIGTTARLLNGLVQVAKGVAARNGLHDF